MISDAALCPRNGAAALVVALVAGCSSLLDGERPAATPPPSHAPASPLLSRPIRMLQGQGDLHRLVSTPSPKAQTFYDQGLALLASYSWVDAARSFHQALRADPALAEAMVGLAKAQRALGEAIAARRSLTSAERAAGATRVGERERWWVELALLQQRAIDSPAAEAERHAREYRRAIETYLRAYPRDPDGFVLRGDAESGPDGQGQTGAEGSLRWYRAALALAPDHPAAHHHLAHSLENLGLPAEALDHARRFAELAPAAPHAHHLVGHLLPSLGRWQEAIEAFERADRQHGRCSESDGLSRAADWHYGHNLHLLAAARWHLGQSARAEALWRRAFGLRERGPRAGALCLPWLELMLLEGRDHAALEGARQCASRGGAAEQAIGRAVEGEVMAARDDLRTARELLTEAETALDDAWTRAGGLPAAGVAVEAAARAIRSLRGKIALAESDGDAGERRLDALALALASQRDFDAWSSALLRLHELERYADHHGRAELAARIAGLIANSASVGTRR